MKTKVNSCALPGQMTLEEIASPTLQRKHGSSTQKVYQRVNEKNCRNVLAEKFGVSLNCVAIVDWCWCKDGDILCIRAYIQRVEHLVQFKGGFSDPTPKVFKVTD